MPRRASTPIFRARRRRRLHRRAGSLALLAPIVLIAGYLIASRGGGTPAPPVRARELRTQVVRSASTARAPIPPHVSVLPPRAAGAGWSLAARVHGHPAAWLRRGGGVTLMRFDQRYVHLTLHAGSSDGGVSGWTYGDTITPREIHLLIAGFNGGFKLSYSDVGFMSAGHVAVPLKSGLASVVTYTDGTTDIGAWHRGLPSPARQVFSVLQNQHLLIDHGRAAANLATCVINCWGGTIRYLTVVARSGLGIDSRGRLIWAAGEQLSPTALADALLRAGAVRAIELDINPFWVAGYLFTHHASGPRPVALVPGQHGIHGRLLAPNTRDFFAVVAN